MSSSRSAIRRIGRCWTRASTRASSPASGRCHRRRRAHRGHARAAARPATRPMQAPMQMKANNGFLLIDDLGRQRIEPQVLFNRWIVPMDCATGLADRRARVTISWCPFDVVLVFSTNLEPEDIADEAFLRRIGYKIELRAGEPEPVPADLAARLRASADRLRRRHRATTSSSSCTDRRHVPLLPCHPRDLLGMALDRIDVPRDAAQLDKRSAALGLGQLFPSPQ